MNTRDVYTLTYALVRLNPHFTVMDAYLRGLPPPDRQIADFAIASFKQKDVTDPLLAFSHHLYRERWRRNPAGLIDPMSAAFQSLAVSVEQVSAALDRVLKLVASKKGDAPSVPRSPIT